MNIEQDCDAVRLLHLAKQCRERRMIRAVAVGNARLHILRRQPLTPHITNVSNPARDEAQAARALWRIWGAGELQLAADHVRINIIFRAIQVNPKARHRGGKWACGARADRIPPPADRHAGLPASSTGAAAPATTGWPPPGKCAQHGAQKAPPAPARRHCDGGVKGGAMLLS